MNTQQSITSHANVKSGKVPDPLEDPPASTLPISIVSNSGLLSEGLTTLLASYFQLTLVATYRGEAFPSYEHLPACSTQIALIDSRIGREPALEWTHLWRSRNPPVCVIIMELANDPDLIVDCIAAGVAAYTLQGASIAELAETIQLARQGLARCGMDITAQVFARLEAAEKNHGGAARTGTMQALLSYREMQVVDCIVRGYSNKQIAAELVISLFTVKHHIHNILGKLNLSQRWDIARLASQEGWLNSD